MKYIAILHHYVSGLGHQGSEQIEGTTDALFSADDYAQNLEDEENAWTEIEINFFADNADPMFDTPIHTSVSNNTIAGKL